MANNQPTLLVVAGSNGAGKSTHSRNLLPEEMEGLDIWDFDIQFNDLKKQMVQDGIPVKEANVKANDQVNDWFNELRNTAMDSKSSFAYEGHFTEGSHWQPLLEAKQEGYFVHMVYLGLKDELTSIHRVNRRTKAGGHYAVVNSKPY
jgi:predicted ABC-type ATPase